MTEWRVSWNAKYYDYKRVIADFRNRTNRIIEQSHGKASMTNVPQVGDIVYITCKKKEILICKVLIGFNDEKNQHYHQNDTYNIGENRPHADDKNKCCTLQILEAPLNPNELRGVQRTWSRYPH